MSVRNLRPIPEVPNSIILHLLILVLLLLVMIAAPHLDTAVTVTLVTGPLLSIS